MSRRSQESQISILLQLYNSAAVAYINRRGDSIPNFVSINKKFVTVINIFLQVQYLPAVQNYRRGIQNVVNKEAISTTAPSILHLETRPLTVATNAFTGFPQKTVCQSTLGSDRQSPIP